MTLSEAYKILEEISVCMKGGKPSQSINVDLEGAIDTILASKDIAVKFAEWLRQNAIPDFEIGLWTRYKENETPCWRTSEEELFNYFILNIYTP